MGHHTDQLQSQRLDQLYQKIEQAIRQKCVDGGEAQILADEACGLLEELKQYQTDLEQRNWQLCQSQHVSEEKFRILAETTSASIFIHQNTEIRYVNPAAVNLTGYSKAELMSMYFWDVIHPDFRQMTMDRDQDRRSHKQPEPQLELKIMTKSGEVRWIDAVLAPIEFEGSAAVLGTAFDITERKQAEQEALNLNHKLLTLQYAGAIIASSLDLPYILGTVTNEMINLLEVEACAISEWKRNEDRVVAIAEQGLGYWDTEKISNGVYQLVDYPLTRQVLTERRAVQMTLSQKDIDRAECEFMRAHRIKTLLMLPMEFLDHVVGLVEVIDRDVERTFGHDEIALAQLLANQAAIAIENARLYAEINQRLEEQIALREAGMAISFTLDRDTVLRQIAKHMAQVVDATSTYLCSYEADSLTSSVITEYFGPRASQVELISDLNIVYDLPRDFTANFDQLLAGQPEILNVNDPDMDKDRLGHMIEFGAKTILNIPLLVGGKVIAFAELWESERSRQFTTEEIALCQGIAQQAAVALENARLYDQVQLELAERIEAQLDLHRIASRNAAILNAIPDSMFLLNLKGELLEYTLVEEDFWPDLSNDSVKRNQLQALLPAEMADLIQARISQFLTTGPAQILEYQHSFSFGVRDFEIRLMLSSTNEVLVIVRNNTERKQAERQAIRSERLTALGQLAATLAHEMNNPLQSIQAYLDLILDFPLEEGESDEYLEIIRQEIKRLTDIAQNVLNYAQPKLAPRQEINISDLLARVLTLTRKQMQHSGIELVTDLRRVPPVFGAPTQLSQVFLNLVINAVEALAQNQGQLHIVVYPEGDDVAISFTSNGPTIPPEILSRIFEPFFTTKPDGSGLGLWVSHSLTQQHNGTLTVENLGDHHGVIFTVKLPAVSQNSN